MTPGAPIVPPCSKCAANKNSDQVSCCASGGAWFNQCGDDGDPNFKYTWTQGIYACKGKFREVEFLLICFLSLSSAVILNLCAPGVTIAPPCSKCGMSKKNGKLSCCSFGGAWFDKCGDDDDPNFEYTWTQGIESCKGKCILMLVFFFYSQCPYVNNRSYGYSHMPKMRREQEKRQAQLLLSWWCLVPELWGRRR